MKRGIVEFVAKCLNCQKVKVETRAQVVWIRTEHRYFGMEVGDDQYGFCKYFTVVA